MSVMHEEQVEHVEAEAWLDTWWPLLVILFGVAFVSLLLFYYPRVW